MDKINTRIAAQERLAVFCAFFNDAALKSHFYWPKRGTYHAIEKSLMILEALAHKARLDRARSSIEYGLYSYHLHAAEHIVSKLLRQGVEAQSIAEGMMSIMFVQENLDIARAHGFKNLERVIMIGIGAGMDAGYAQFAPE
jgi:hypothetical protein